MYECHHAPQFPADRLDGMRRVIASSLVELRPTLAILVDPRRRERTIPHLLE
jgi:hypothetical protein